MLKDYLELIEVNLMVNVYESLRDGNGNMASGRTKLFILSTDEDGSIQDFLSGYAIVPESQGTLFITDEYVVEQIDKVQFKDGALSVKEGEELIPPVKSEKQLQIEAIERQLAALKAEPDEPAGTEEQIATPLLDYTDEPTE